MYNKQNIEILKKRIEAQPTSSPSIWFYYLGMAKFKIKKNNYSQNTWWISLKLNKWNPLTLLYIFGIILKSLKQGIIKGYKDSKRRIREADGTSYMVDLSN